jgi:hypothetical protein
MRHAARSSRTGTAGAPVQERPAQHVAGRQSLRLPGIEVRKHVGGCAAHDLRTAGVRVEATRLNQQRA